MKHYLFECLSGENEGEEFIIGADCYDDAKDMAFELFGSCKYHGQMTEMEAERGNDFVWQSCKVCWMLRNIAYKGDLLTHKTVVKDYLSGKAVKNDGYREQYYLKGHPPAIISEEQFENVQTILESRSKKWKEARAI